MTEFPTTCPACKQRRDSHDSAFRDWEAARKPLERSDAMLCDVVVAYAAWMESISGPLTTFVPEDAEKHNSIVSRFHATMQAALAMKPSLTSLKPTR